MGRPFELISSEIVLGTAIFKLRKDVALHPETGQPGDYAVLEMSDFVNMIPETDDGDVLMVRQWRHGTREIELELPAGLVDDGEPALQAAQRELLEETGHSSQRWTELGVVRPNPAYTANHCTTFWAQGCVETAATSLDETEDIELVRVRASELVTLLREGTLRSSTMVAAVFWWLDKRARISW